MRLRDDAALPQQDQRHEAMGAALDQELPVWRSVEEDPSYSALTLYAPHCHTWTTATPEDITRNLNCIINVGHKHLMNV